MTRCVRTLGAGVPARTSASPAGTSAVDAPAWTAAIFMRGELCTSMHTQTQIHQQRHPRVIPTAGLHCASEINGVAVGGWEAFSLLD